MKDLTTHVPPTIRRIDGELVICTSFEINGEAYSVSAPIGDGRYHAERVFDLVIGPALGWHPMDERRPRPLAPVDLMDI